MDNLKQRGHEPVVVIRPKDVLEQLCINAQISYVKVKNRPKKWGMLGLALSLVGKTIETAKIVRKAKPDMLVGSDGVLAVVGKMYHIPAFECFEDDVEAIMLYAKMFFPLYTRVICPEICRAGKWAKKKIGYNSYHELGYLHPNQFTPDKKKVQKYGIDTELPYFIIRFAKLTAHHDVGIHGMNTEITEKVIAMLKPHGQIYITSEKTLDEQFEQYRIKIDPLDIHHVMAFASMFIGDSQTMNAEAGVLGVPFVHFNDFVGRLSYLNELEQYYHLGNGHKTNDVDGFYHSIQNWLNTTNRTELCQQRRQKMLTEKIDYTKFLTWYLDKYPESDEIMRTNPQFQNKFK
jgi:predicted glycosyltransferase